MSVFAAADVIILLFKGQIFNFVDLDMLFHYDYCLVFVSNTKAILFRTNFFEEEKLQFSSVFIHLFNRSFIHGNFLNTVLTL